jgi:hypothetical protein
MQKFKQLDIQKKGKKHIIKVTYNKDEVSKEGDVWGTEYSKKTNQYLSQKLSDNISALVPHLLWTTELISEELAVSGGLDYQAWFKENKYLDDSRFDNVELTKIQFIGKEQLDGVKLFGFKKTTKVGKGFKVKIETPVINLDRTKDGAYALVAIMEAQLSDLDFSLEKYLEEGETLSKAQQATLFEQLEAQEA